MKPLLDKKPRYFSMFSGVGGFELGIGDMAECIGYSEIDKYAIKTYEEHFEHENYGDATTIQPSRLPDFDFLVGGFPCQAFSIAGKRAGFNDTRGTLFFEVARILKDKRPRHFILENVKGLLSHDEGKTFRTILGVLADLGYRVEWQVLNAKYHGVPQNRERVFIVGHLGGDCGRQVFPLAIGGGQNAKTGKKEQAGKSWVSTLDSRYGQRWSTETYVRTRKSDSQNRQTQPDDNHAKRGGAYPHHQGDLLQGVSNKRATRQPAQWRRTEKGKAYRRKAQARGKDLTPFNDGHRELVPKDSETIGAITSQAVAKDSLLFDNTRIRRLTPLECERLMGWPDNWTIGSDTQRYKQCGNGVVSKVVSAIMERLQLCLA